MPVQGSGCIHKVLILVFCAEGAQKIGLLLQRKRRWCEVKSYINTLWRSNERTAHKALRPSKIVTL